MPKTGPPNIAGNFFSVPFNKWAWLVILSLNPLKILSSAGRCLGRGGWLKGDQLSGFAAQTRGGLGPPDQG